MSSHNKLEIFDAKLGGMRRMECADLHRLYGGGPKASGTTVPKSVVTPQPEASTSLSISADKEMGTTGNPALPPVADGAPE